MNTKKTWFSYILWLIATGFSLLFIYSNGYRILRYFGLSKTENVIGCIGYGIGFTGIIAGVFFLIVIALRKINIPEIPAGKQKIIHILIFVLIGFCFLYTRISAMQNMDFNTSAVQNIYQISMISNELPFEQSQLSVPEIIYSKTLSFLFLFSGNKISVILFFQMFLQVITFIFMIIVGFISRKGFFSWMPALLYAFSPFFAKSVTNPGYANCFSCLLLIAVVVIALIAFVLNKRIDSNIVIATLGALCGMLIIVSCISSDYVLVATKGCTDYANVPTYFFWELLLGILLLFYCISFWSHGSQADTFYPVPIALFVVLRFCLNAEHAEKKNLVLMLLNVFLFLLIMEGVSMFFSKKNNYKYTTEQSTADTAGVQWDSLDKKEETVQQIKTVRMMAESDQQLKASFEPLLENEPQNSLDDIDENTSVNAFEPLENSKTKENSEQIGSNNTVSSAEGFKWWEKETGMEEYKKTTNESGSETNTSTSDVVFFEDIDIDAFESQGEGDDAESTEEISEEPEVIKVSDIMKEAVAANPDLENQLNSQTNAEEPVDKTAMIENVLPMPKKHENRTLDYAFEPSEDMMHYDVEIENDDYDYE